MIFQMNLLPVAIRKNDVVSEDRVHLFSLSFFNSFNGGGSANQKIDPIKRMAILKSNRVIDSEMACSGVWPNHLKTTNKPASRVPMPKNDTGIIAIKEVIVIIRIT